MDYLFRLADGRRLALWSEKNQIIRQLSGGGGNRSHTTLRTDFLSDFSAASIDGKIYFAYQNTSRRVMLYLPDGEEDRMLFGESIESCRHSGMTLTAWRGNLYLFYLAWSPIRERYSLKVRKILENGELKAGGDYGAGDEQVLTQDYEEAPEFQIVAEKDCLRILTGEKNWRLDGADDGGESWRQEGWMSGEIMREQEERQKEIEELRNEVMELRNERAELEESVMRTEKKNVQLNEAVTKTEKENEQLEGAVTKAERENAQLKETALRQKENFSAEKRQYIEEIERLSEEREKLRLENRAQSADYQTRLQSAVNQYNELAEITRQLQTEGKKWRDKYFQEAKKAKGKVPAAGVNKGAE